MAKRGPKKLEVRINKTAKKVEKEIINQGSENAEKEKLMFMRVGVACIMVIFFVAWVFNLKYQFKINSNSNSGKSAFNWAETKAELDKAMGQVKDGLAQIKQAREQAQKETPAPELTSKQVDLLKGKLMIEVASSTNASSTIRN